jgi:predicted protein tyrosine phosphatase
MPKIINISYAQAQSGDYPHPGDSVLIQITDPGTPAPTTAHKYLAKHHFQFHDADDNNGAGEFPYVPKVLIKDEQAKQIVEILRNAIDNDTNVVVHCHAGICRSGAVCEVGVMMGFDDPERVRLPNRLVKYKLMRELGWTYE